MSAIDAATREAMLFSGIGFLIGGLDDLLVDALYLAVRARGGFRRDPSLGDLALRAPPRRIAVFVAAWDEAAVIGGMLSTALARFDHGDYRLYVGAYPNDPETIRAAAAVAARDARVRLVIGARDGPTTKADCLNAIWHALARDEARDGSRAAAIVLHDAEDVVHRDELRVFDALIGRYAVVQIPVLPLIDRRAPLVSGHYADEFAIAHGEQMVVRQAIGAGLPLAGVGCAVARDVLERMAAARDGRPFDEHSLTEDYELGLSLARTGGGGAFVRIRERPGGPLVAVRAYFPSTVATAVRQKARWMTGIALAGWDRIGWSHLADWREHWMRMRDRRTPLAVLVLAGAYVALVGAGASAAGHWLARTPGPALAAPVALLLWINGALLAWRLAMRALFTGLAYGPIEAAWSLPRALVANYIALLAARKAVWRYAASLRGETLRWDKTTHVFPDDPGAAGG